MKTFIKQHRSNLTIATIIALVVIASGAIWFTVRAAGFFAAIEPDNASLTTNAKVVTDSTASGGKAIQFTAPATTPPPNGGSTCTTKPDATNTGPTGSLTLDNRSNLSVANEVISNKTFPGDIVISAHGVKLSNVHVNGMILINEVDNIDIEYVSTRYVAISSASNASISYSHISAFEDDSFHITSDGVDYINNVTIKHNFIDRPGFNPGSLAHWDGVQIRGADYVTIFCNNFDVGEWQDPYNVLVYSEPANGNNDHIVVDNNWLNGGNFAIMAGLPRQPMNFSITNNKLRKGDFHFGVCYLGTGFTSQNLIDVVQTGNTLDGAPIAQVCKESDL